VAQARNEWRASHVGRDRIIRSNVAAALLFEGYGRIVASGQIISGLAVLGDGRFKVHSRIGAECEFSIHVSERVAINKRLRAARLHDKPQARPRRIFDFISRGLLWRFLDDNVSEHGLSSRGSAGVGLPPD